MRLTKKNRYLKEQSIKEAYGDDIYMEIRCGKCTVDIKYTSLLIAPQGIRQRDHDAYVRRIIKLAAENGGCKLYKLQDDTKIYL